jgi:hypothetical protein
MNKPRPIINPHRFARLIAWAQAMLAWMALVMFSNAAANRRHIRQRYRFVSLDWVERFVRAAAIIRAIEITHARADPRRTRRNTAPNGFRRRIARSAYLRAVAGSRFRRALKHRDITERLRRLMAALVDIDAFARRTLVARARRRLTRLCPVVLVAPRAAALVRLTAAPPAPANTS